MSIIKENCIFCKIVKRELESKIVFEDDEFLVFQDIKPAAKVHYLIIPKSHEFNTPKELKSSNINLVERMVDISKKVVESHEKLRMGFHWPPFNSVSHLHMHIISPISDLSWCNRIIFRPDSYWFITTEKLLETLQK